MHRYQHIGECTVPVMGHYRSVTELLQSITEHYGSNVDHYRKLWNVTECYRALWDVTARYESIADRYGTLQERYKALRKHYGNVMELLRKISICQSLNF